MAQREIYVLDEGTGKVLDRFPVDGWPETKILALERRILSQVGEDVVVRDSRLDRLH